MRASNFGKSIASSGSAVTAVGFQRRASFRCCCHNAPYLLRQLIWRLKSHWKRALGGRQRNSVQYSYDLRSLAFAADWSILNPKFRHGLGDSLNRYCESWRINVEVNNIRGFEVVPQECVQHIQKYMKSSQYKADSEKALEEVKLYLSSCCNLEGDGKDAWIFDVDDTLLSTIPYYEKHGFGGRKRNTTSLESWMRKSKAPALKHTLSIFHEIKDKGVKIFLISSRRETLRSHTVDNLIDAGYHGWSGLSLRGLEDELFEVKKYKSVVRQRLVDEGYRIWGIVGDQWSSLEGQPSAGRTFKLPNSIYYLA